MPKEFQKFLQSLILFTLAIGAIIYFLSKFLVSGNIGGYTWASLIYFATLTLVFHYGLLRSTQGKPQQFFRYFMTATTLKLVLHLMIVIGYTLTYRANAVNFIISFFILYILFTFFEVKEALKISKVKTK